MSAHHAQEPTAASATETLIDRQDVSELPHLTPVSPFTGNGIQVQSPDHITHARVHEVEATIDPHSYPSVIPPIHEHRTLVLCFDGTGDQFDADNSNIVQLVSLLKKDDKNKQMVYYQSGIGTYTPVKFVTPFISRIQKTLDTMVAWNLDHHVMGGYQFLMQNYIKGDNICIFGFSRGAYTARSLAGMLHKVGLLPADNIQQVPFAYKMYKTVDNVGWELANGFKKAFCIDVDIEFVGVWDTVDSVGIIPKRLPFTTSNTIVHTFRHAVSLDERRAKFKANLWNRPTDDEAKLGVQASPQSPAKVQARDVPQSPVSSVGASSTTKGDKRRKKREESEEDKKLNAMEEIYSAPSQRQTDIEEVWFAGCHCDVGGGSVSNKTRHALGRISLRWMVRECFKTKTGIMFNAEALRQIGLDPATLYPIVTPRPPPLPISSEHKIRKPPADPIPIRPHAMLLKQSLTNHTNGASPYPEAPMLRSEEEEELHDALSPAYDQLKLKKGWWILELLPMQLRYQRGDNQWVTHFGSNLGRPRFIPKQVNNGVKVHRSVNLRMAAEFEAKNGKKYIPKAHLRVEPTWID